MNGCEEARGLRSFAFQMILIIVKIFWNVVYVGSRALAGQRLKQADFTFRDPSRGSGTTTHVPSADPGSPHPAAPPP